MSNNYRAIAIDLIGMGKSDKPDIGYTYLEHREYVNAFIEALDLHNITFVIHDWGSVLGFDYAMKNEDNVAGIALMEALVPPSLPFAAEPSAESIFGRFRTPGEGEKLIIEENYFVEQMIPGAVVREMSVEEMNVYREPYLEPASGLLALKKCRGKIFGPGGVAELLDMKPITVSSRLQKYRIDQSQFKQDRDQRRSMG